jgi:hypothetical protein
VDFFKLGLLVPLLPLFLIPLLLVGAAWVDRRRHARGDRMARGTGPVAADPDRDAAQASSQPRSRPSDA